MGGYRLQVENMSSPSSAFVICWRPMRSTISSSTRTAWAASARLARYPHWQGLSDPCGAACCLNLHNYHVVMASLNSPMASSFPRSTLKWAMSCFGISSTASQFRQTDISTSTKTLHAWP